MDADFRDWFFWNVLYLAVLFRNGSEAVYGHLPIRISALVDSETEQQVVT